MATANAPPSMKKKVTAARYSRPIRLWSFVRSHDFRVVPLFR
jgi:hypothetical protein